MKPSYQLDAISNPTRFNPIGSPLFGLFLGGLLLMSGCATQPSTVQSSTISCSVTPETVTATQSQADTGEAASQYQVGLWYETGRCLKRDKANATEWFRRAAEQGHADAQYELGRIYYDYYRYGIEQDNEEAARWYQRAAEQGHPLAAFWLGDLYVAGSGVARDFDRAEYWYRRAFEGNAISQTELDRRLDNFDKIRDQQRLAEKKREATEKAKHELDRLAEERERDPAAWERKQQRLAEERKQEQQRLAEARKQEEQRLAEEKLEAEEKAEQGKERLVKARRKAAQTQFGVVAVVVPPIEPELANEQASLAFLTLGLPFGTAGAGAVGGLTLGTCAGYCFTGPGAAIGAGVGLVGGFVVGVAGSVVGVSQRISKRRAISKLEKVYEEANPSVGLRDQVLRRGEKTLTNRLVAGELPDSTDAMRNGSFAPSGIDTILEIADVRAGFVETDETDWSNRFFMTANSRVIHAVDNTVLAEWELRYERQSAAVRDWVKDDAKPFHGALEAGYIDLADKLLAHLLGLADISPSVPTAPEAMAAEVEL